MKENTIGIILVLAFLLLISGCTMAKLTFDDKEVTIEDVKIGKKCLACHGKHPKILTPN